ncbi:RNA methyltransferase [Natronomonas sp. F2-12]|jgi:TrmH family RNA methyltransferase|uniref:RNA methyltransferase n=1 Tax=Natronomonas aquatica TaxID=2841590 RepID=A0A9R1CQP4_9EURY|nr:RNA methyltransferase [Natronomonas aquatica]MCQ4333323.1 RNA methyltransferase [Natronomonas aquatica]
MVDIAVAVVGAETPGNVGTIARSMKNFGLAELYLVDPPELDPDGEAYGFAGHAREDVLPNAETVPFEYLVENFYTVACTATTNQDATSHVRYPFLEPAELAGKLAEVDADVCVVFGRERVGLTNEELAELDRICSIPASGEYPVLNLAQAATIVLYELRGLTVESTQHPEEAHERAEEHEIEGLYATFSEYLHDIGHPDEKIPKTERLFRRLVGRAHPTGREARTMRGVLRRGAMRASGEIPRDSSSDAEREG